MRISNESSVKRPIIISLDAIIGAGKSFLIKQICDHINSTTTLRVYPIYEPVETWRKDGMLEIFYSNPKIYGYMFQTYVLSTRILSCIKEMNRPDHLDANIFILERSIFTDKYIFKELMVEQKIMNEIHCVCYDKIWALWKICFDKYVGKIDLYIHLDTSTAIAKERIIARARPEELHKVTVEYQKQLKIRHDDFFRLLSDSDENILKITDALACISKNNSYYHKIIDKICSLILDKINLPNSLPYF